MKPSPFTYHRPASLPEALDVLARVGADGKVLAGGQSLIPLLSMRLAAPGHLVDLNAVPGLGEITVLPDAVRVGALVRHAALERSAEARVAQPLLGQALRHVAHPTIRNRGTTVGSLVHADPSAEMPAVLALLGGSVVAASARGEREVPVGELYAGPMETTLEPDELVVAAVFPRSAARTGSGVVEVSRRHGDFAVCGVVAAVTLDGHGGVETARASYVTAGRLGQVVDLTDAVRSVSGDAAVPGWTAAGESAAGQVEVDGDVHATAAYRSHLVRVLTTRAVEQAARQATGVAEEVAA